MQKTFKQSHYTLEYTSNKQELQQKLNSHEYQSILIDLDLIPHSEFALIQQISNEIPSACLLAISSNFTVEDKIKFLDAGVDDLFLKPVRYEEIQAKMKRILRRIHQIPFSNQLIFKNLTFHLEKFNITVDGQELDFTKKEFEILLFLARNYNRVISKERLTESIWGDHMDMVNAHDFIYSHLKNIRRKLKAVDQEHLVKTVYGNGYMFTN